MTGVGDAIGDAYLSGGKVELKKSSAIPALNSRNTLLDQLREAKFLGPKLKDRVWLVRYMPTDKEQSDFYRLFVTWDSLLESLSLPIERQHPAWQHPFEIWLISFEEISISDITEEVLNLVLRRQQNEQYADRSPEEHNNRRAE